ncbi:hypothetical protein PV08_07208 [Exophiala spinifera]|uniref:FAD-binding FR-type domain-containing protein n=1 Tax=Exophiala spinifera TaxID=91928 RepID=A0A0D2B6X3_9EURO|nr:uncharacterized protein PV08_07208 [Exophiala spinifera]KIW14425.1 hypothetical protein PV08_07208 [Exophiala spinifera]
MAFFQPSDWHEGEKAIHKRTRVEYNDNPTSPFLYPRAAHQASRYPLLAFGALDSDNNPWCTVWGTGEPPIAQAIGQSVLGIRTVVDASFDPVVQAIYQGKSDGEVLREDGTTRLMSALSINLEERGRLKLAGYVVAGALNVNPDSSSAATSPDTSIKDESSGKAGEIQLVTQITQALGNCPKYLNKKLITSSTPTPKLLSTSPHLTDAALAIIAKSDLFFLTTSHEHEDMDCNHRGGPPGFVRVDQPSSSTSPTSLVWPEYSGNNLYQTLGNLETTPRAGLVFPDFETGDVLYVTGETTTLVGTEASNVIAKSTLAVRLNITSARLVQTGLSFRGTPTDDATHGLSPYNPRVRYLLSEQKETTTAGATPGSSPPTTASLVAKTRLTPTITRYRFALGDPAVFGPWKPGQYVTLDVSADLDLGYSHMRDDDPTSLNDDFIRTFTVSSVPGALGVHGEEFEITARSVGTVTNWLERQRPGMCEVGIRGFGGDFVFDWGDTAADNKADTKTARKKTIGFVAAGIGITPLLGQMGSIPEDADDGSSSNTDNISAPASPPRLRVWWSLGAKDVNLALDILQTYPRLSRATKLFITGWTGGSGQSTSSTPAAGGAKAHTTTESDADSAVLAKLAETGVTIYKRRLAREDLLDDPGLKDDGNDNAAADADDDDTTRVDNWYICTAPAMRKVVQGWMPDKAFVFENFDY